MPYNPDGRRGREGYRLVTPLASMPPHEMPDVFDDDEPPAAESQAPSSNNEAPRGRRGPSASDRGDVANGGGIRGGIRLRKGLQVVSADYIGSTTSWSYLRTNGF